MTMLESCMGAVIDGEYLCTANQIISDVVARVGVANPVGELPDYTLGLYLSSEQQLSDVLDDISASVGGAWSFNRLNQLQLLHFNGVAATTDQLGLDDIEDASLLPIRRIAPASSITLGYCRNWTPQADGLAGSVREQTPELATLYEQSQRQLSQTGLVDSNAYPDAASINVSTLIANEADARTELTRRAALASNAHTVFELTAFAAPLAMQLGQSIALTYPQYFRQGGNVVITRLTDVLTDNCVRMEVWR